MGDAGHRRPAHTALAADSAASGHPHPGQPAAAAASWHPRGAAVHSAVLRCPQPALPPPGKQPAHAWLLPGCPSRPDPVPLCDCTSPHIPSVSCAPLQASWPFYLALSIFRLAAILAGVGARAAQGNASSRIAAQVPPAALVPPPQPQQLHALPARHHPVVVAGCCCRCCLGHQRFLCCGPCLPAYSLPLPAGRG